MKHRFAYQFACSIGVLLCALAASTSAQSTSFNYQGRLTDGGTPANGSYDLQFALFDSVSAGAQIGSTVQLNSTAVSTGVFTVSLDFGVNAFTGADRFLEIGVRPSGVGSFTTLSPRQQINSTPYSIRTLSAAAADLATNANQLAVSPQVSMSSRLIRDCLTRGLRQPAQQTTFRIRPTNNPLQISISVAREPQPEVCALLISILVTRFQAGELA